MPEVIERFHDEYERRFGQRFTHLPVQGVTYRVQFVVEAPKVEHPELPVGAAASPPLGTVQLRGLAAEPLTAAVHDRATLAAGAAIAGPAIIREDLSTTLVMPGQLAEVGSRGEIVIERDRA